jgi:hypothetical protein
VASSRIALRSSVDRHMERRKQIGYEMYLSDHCEAGVKMAVSAL